MPRKNQDQLLLCQICKERKKTSEVLSADLVRPAIAETIQKEYPDWSVNGFICLSDLNHFRTQYIRTLVEKEMGELSDLEMDVMRSLQKQELLSKNLNVEFERERTLGERLADRIADFGGSWAFIASFFFLISAWIALNTMKLFGPPLDPFPYILLNLVLSCIAAIQAPVIMMSQNRQEAKDRLRAEYDYKVNLKAELEIRHLHEKVDHILASQWQRLVEIQQIQMELIEEMASRGPGSKKV